MYLVKLPGQMRIGGCLSLTVTLKPHVASGGVPLEAVQLTIVAPVWKKAPEGGLQVTVGIGLPVAVAIKVTIAAHWLGSVF